MRAGWCIKVTGHPMKRVALTRVMSLISEHFYVALRHSISWLLLPLNRTVPMSAENREERELRKSCSEWSGRCVMVVTMKIIIARASWNMGVPWDQGSFFPLSLQRGSLCFLVPHLKPQVPPWSHELILICFSGQHWTSYKHHLAFWIKSSLFCMGPATTAMYTVSNNFIIYVGSN